MSSENAADPMAAENTWGTRGKDITRTRPEMKEPKRHETDVLPSGQVDFGKMLDEEKDAIPIDEVDSDDDMLDVSLEQQQ